jgi:hypothetical protein
VASPNPEQQMMLLLGYFVSLAATFVMSVAVLSFVLAATGVNQGSSSPIRYSVMSKDEHTKLLIKSRLAAAKEPSNTKALWSVVER